MHSYKQEFIQFALACGVLEFGRFTLKSGRESPYFFNAGLFDSGLRLKRLGEYYAAALQAGGVAYDMLFGPAYKGIPLATATAVGLAARFERDVPYAFDRKEAKDHGEGGSTVGAPVAGRVMVIDDVISSGKSVRQAAEIIAQQGARLAGVCIALDREERGLGALSAKQEVELAFGVPVVSIATLHDLCDFLAGKPDLARHLADITAYAKRHGASGP